MEHEHACSTHYHARARCDCQIDTADHVHHAPSGEDWVVAYVRGDRLGWCGWPPGEAALADCTLLKKAIQDERDKLLHEMAGSMNSGVRQVYARDRLAARHEPPNKGEAQQRQRETIDLAACYGLALRQRMAKEKAEKAAKRKARR